MSSRPIIPHGYAVVQLDDKQWYPLRVTRFYNVEHPGGYVYLDTLSDLNQEGELRDVCYPRREDAVQYVQQTSRSDEAYERSKWLHIMIQSDVYPERCSHFLTLIEEITGQAPIVRQWMHVVSVLIKGCTCSCGHYVPPYWAEDEATIEDALQRATEYVYEHRCCCTATSAYEYEQRLTA